MKPLRHHLRNAFLPHAGNEFHPHLLRWPWVHAMGGFIIVVKVVTIVTVTFYAGQAHQSSVTPAAIIQQTNKARATQGLAGLKANAALAKAATSKANDMLANDYFAHISPKKVTPWYWFTKAGYRYTTAGENLAIDYVSSEDVIQAWLNSPTHRKNLLNSKYKDIGVAVVTGEIQGSTSVVVVQMFGAPVKTTSTIATTQPKQQPNPATTKKNLTTQAPTVLGQQTSTAITKPIVSSPAVGSIVRGAPTFVGTAEPGSVLSIRVTEKILESQTVPASGVFSITVPNTLADGPHTFTLTSSARGQQISTTWALNLDQEAPQINSSQTMILPSILGEGIYDVMVAPTPDTTSVQVEISGQQQALHKTAGTFIGQVQLKPSTSPIINAVLIDQAGNSTHLPLLDPQLFSSGVVASHGPAYSALQTIFFSRAFLVLFMLLMIAGMVVNVSMTWHRQHHPALLPTLLLVYLSGALFFL